MLSSEHAPSRGVEPFSLMSDRGSPSPVGGRALGQGGGNPAGGETTAAGGAKVTNAQMYVAADVVSVNGLVEHLLDQDSSPAGAHVTEETGRQAAAGSEKGRHDRATGGPDKVTGAHDKVTGGHESINCDECLSQFANIQSYMDHRCSQFKMAMTAGTPPDETGGSTSDDDDDDDDDDDEISDGESFDGKIVYNADGSAYIIEGGGSDDMYSDDGTPDGSSGVSPRADALFAPIANAFYINRNMAMSYLEKRPLVDAPVMHSYRVFDMRSSAAAAPASAAVGGEKDESALPTPPRSQHVPRRCLVAPPSVPTKPILMCFLCKLSFGMAKSFVAHAVGEHGMQLNMQESRLLGQRDASAIIQGLGRQKQPLMSFLEPIATAASAKEAGSGEGREEGEGEGSADGKENVAAAAAAAVAAAAAAAAAAVTTQFTAMASQALAPLTSQLAFLSAGQQAAPVQGIVIRAGCDDHPQGNITGLQCTKCEEAGVGRAGALGGPGPAVTLTHSRNSCKTLKCPRCNWHYKYQETLEIHMKEKHADVEGAQCAYCLSGRPHPRLARGEAYGCGYKPYRCDVCNYSTTTKGNLSIHMQSDKHINNMQELQAAPAGGVGGGGSEGGVGAGAVPLASSPAVTGGGAVAVAAAAGSMTPGAEAAAAAAKKSKTKPIWRCDVCNYETNVARNLRIHMTSEKHTHNMLVLQQNMKHMQHDMHLQLSQMAYLGSSPSPSSHLDPSLPPPPGLAFPDHPLFMPPPPPLPLSDSPMDLRTQENGLSPPPSAAPDSDHLFECRVCDAFATDSLPALQAHMTADVGGGGDDASAGLTSCDGGSHACHVCAYRTPLRANFQLHCKTDKHVQRARLARHCLLGGDPGRLRNFFGPAPAAQLLCTACAHRASDLRKLHAHVADARHEACAALWRHLAASSGGGVPADGRRRYYHCTLCGVSTRTRRALIAHARSLDHARHESVCMLRAPDRDALTPDKMFIVRECGEADSIVFTDGQ